MRIMPSGSHGRGHSREHMSGLTRTQQRGGAVRADRHELRRLPEVELADLARSVDGALICPRAREQRAHLA